MGQKTITTNSLFYGDNLPILRDYLADESVDLIYLDPPFNSSRSYNVLYKDESGIEAEAQIVAFEDTWHWSHDTEAHYRQLVALGDKLAQLLETLVSVLGRNQMTAYLVMMTARLLELYRVLKPTGSLYLHCDPTASHYLKMILDMIFGVRNYCNHITWKRSDPHNDAKNKFPSISDHLLLYHKSEQFLFKKQYTTHANKTLHDWYQYLEFPDGTVRRMTREEKQTQIVPEGARRFNTGDMSAPEGGGMAALNKQTGKPNGWYEYKEYKPPQRGWRYSPETMAELEAKGLLLFPPKKTGRIMLKRYLDEQAGAVIGDVWSDISQIRANNAERLNYPTQKPVALLERIIQASSNPGDVILDPFCGCGTAIHAAQKLNRTWIGIDINYLATALIKNRLFSAFGIEAKKDYDLIGEPTTLSDARHLAKQDRYQFQWWALGLLPARPFGGQADSKQGKKGADKGIDGIMTFRDCKEGTDKRIIVQVKSGKVKSGDIRDLHGTVEREKNAVIGVFVTLEAPSQNMHVEAMECGYYHSTGFNRDYPKIQILSIEQLLLENQKVQFPGTDTTLKQAQREQLFHQGKQEDLL